MKLKKKTKQSGPGIVKLNTKTLEVPKVVSEIETEVKQMMEQTDKFWSPHTWLEFLKVAIRSIVSAKTSKIRRGIREEIGECEDEINQLENLNIKILTDQSQDNSFKQLRTEKVSSATLSLNAKLENHWKKLSDTTSFVTKAKWFEYGERTPYNGRQNSYSKDFWSLTNNLQHAVLRL